MCGLKKRVLVLPKGGKKKSKIVAYTREDAFWPYKKGAVGTPPSHWTPMCLNIKGENLTAVDRGGRTRSKFAIKMLAPKMGRRLKEEGRVRGQGGGEKKGGLVVKAVVIAGGRISARGGKNREHSKKGEDFAYLGGRSATRCRERFKRISSYEE